MMNFTRTEQNDLITIFKQGLNPKVNNFNHSEPVEVLSRILVEKNGGEDLTSFNLLSFQPMVFALLAEAIDEVLPVALGERIGDFAEIKTYGRNDEVVFDIKGMGKRRLWNAITKGARGGVYAYRVLGQKRFHLPTTIWTVGAYITLEELLTGDVTLAELMNTIADGYVQKMYVEVIKALRTAKSKAPAANVASGNGVEDAALTELVQIVSQYGSPVIFGFSQVISKINNLMPVTNAHPNIATADADEYRRQGYVSVYRGTPVVSIPNYLVDETNSAWALKVNDLFILPGDRKPVKVALKGDTVFVENQQPGGAKEIEAHKIMGVGLLLANDVCVYTDSSLDGTIGQY